MDLLQTNGLKEKLQVIPQHPLNIAKQMTGRENLSVDPFKPSEQPAPNFFSK